MERNFRQSCDLYRLGLTRKGRIAVSFQEFAKTGLKFFSENFMIFVNKLWVFKNYKKRCCICYFYSNIKLKWLILKIVLFYYNHKLRIFLHARVLQSALGVFRSYLYSQKNDGRNNKNSSTKFYLQKALIFFWNESFRFSAFIYNRTSFEWKSWNKR